MCWGKAFSNPKLNDFLKEHLIECVEVVGVDGGGCVALTALGAIKEGYSVIVNETAIGTMFLKNKCLLIDKPRKRLTYQMIGGKVEDGETPLKAAIRECHEELGDKAIFDENSLDLVMEFDEIATSDGITPIHFYVFRYNGVLEGELSTSLEIEKFLWYQSNAEEEILSNTLKHKVIPYCLERKLIK